MIGGGGAAPVTGLSVGGAGRFPTIGGSGAAPVTRLSVGGAGQRPAPLQWRHGRAAASGRPPVFRGKSANFWGAACRGGGGQRIIPSLPGEAGVRPQQRRQRPVHGGLHGYNPERGGTVSDTMFDNPNSWALILQRSLIKGTVPASRRPRSREQIFRLRPHALRLHVERMRAQPGKIGP